MKRFALTIAATTAAIAVAGCGVHPRTAADTAPTPTPTATFAQPNEGKYLTYVRDGSYEFRLTDRTTLVTTGWKLCSALDTLTPKKVVANVKANHKADDGYTDDEMADYTNTVMAGAARYLCPVHLAVVNEFLGIPTAAK